MPHRPDAPVPSPAPTSPTPPPAPAPAQSPDGSSEGMLDLDDHDQINNQHLDVR